jgi:hypothetical protein
MSNGHSVYSPSGSSRWLVCPGSIRMEEGKPDSSGAAAAEGTALHEFAALCLDTGSNATDFSGEFAGYELTEERKEVVQQYLNYVRSLPVAEAWVEEWIDLSPFTEETDGGGTTDHTGVNDSTLFVTDLKCGRDPVEVEGNTQELMYAAGKLKQVLALGWEPEWVTLAIVQPRVYDEPQVWTISVAELVHWVDTVLIPGVDATRASETVLVPSDKGCKWCKAKAGCPALMSHAAETTGVATIEEFTDLVQAFAPPAPSKLTDDMLAAIVERGPLVRLWLDAVNDEVERRLKDGVQVPGLKLVRGRKGNRAWAVEEETVIETLRGYYELAPETIHEMKLLSPATLAKLPAIKEDPVLFETLITQKEGALCVAPESDKRAAVVPEAAVLAEFDNITD